MKARVPTATHRSQPMQSVAVVMEASSGGGRRASTRGLVNWFSPDGNRTFSGPHYLRRPIELGRVHPGCIATWIAFVRHGRICMVRIFRARRYPADRSLRRMEPRHRALAAVLLSVAALGIPVSTPVGAQNPLISTPYPSVSVQPGATASFDLMVRADAPIRLDLSVEGAPDGWGVTLLGGGREVSSVYADPAEPPELSLDLAVPDDAVKPL
jgi:hypothetical protein